MNTNTSSSSSSKSQEKGGGEVDQRGGARGDDGRLKYCWNGGGRGPSVPLRPAWAHGHLQFDIVTGPSPSECSGVFTLGGAVGKVAGCELAVCHLPPPQIELRPGLPGYRDHSSRASGRPLCGYEGFPLAQ